MIEEPDEAEADRRKRIISRLVIRETERNIAAQFEERYTASRRNADVPTRRSKVMNAQTLWIDTVEFSWRIIRGMNGHATQEEVHALARKIYAEMEFLTRPVHHKAEEEG